eukprot:7823221-Lingulodinium_polyedra.AAC.1
MSRGPRGRLLSVGGWLILGGERVIRPRAANGSLGQPARPNASLTHRAQHLDSAARPESASSFIQP